MVFVDTNYFLRLLLADVKQQHAEAKEFFKSALAGKVKVFTSTLVIFEIYWVLSSFYNQNKVQVCKTMKDILAMEFVKLDGRDSLRQAVEIYQSSALNLEDAYNLAICLKAGSEKIMTFDAALQKEFTKRSLR